MKRKRAVKKFLSRKSNFAVIISSSILAMSLTAGTCGTFAWFTYATRAYVNYDGVTIGCSSLEIGFMPGIQLTNYANYNLTKEERDIGVDIYWSTKREITPQTIEYILSSMGYATNEMNPVTSGAYHYGDTEFTLLHAPRTVNDVTRLLANKESYIYLPLVFRCMDEIEDDSSYLPNKNIFLTDAEVESDYNIRQSIRIFASQGDTTHLINPTQREDGSTIVGGTLDLDRDGYYDTYQSDFSRYETLYGDFKTEKVHKDSPETKDSDVPESERTTFTARHKAGTFAVDSELTKADTADYEGFAKYKNCVTPVAKTNANTDNYAYLFMSVYIEGWDLSVIDSEKDNPFNLNLRFEVEL